MPGLGSTGSKFQLSAGWRFAEARRSYRGTRFNRGFTRLWEPRERLSILDLTALYRVNSRTRVTATLPIVFNGFSMLFPPLGSGIGQRRGYSVSGQGDFALYAQSFLLDPGEHPFENISLGMGVKPPTGNFGARRVIPNETGVDSRRRAAYPPAIQPGDGGTGILFGYDAYKIMRSPSFLRGTTFFSSGVYLANPRVQNRTPSMIQSLGVPLDPLFINRQRNSVADTWTLRAGFSTRIPRTWDKPLLRGLRLRGAFHWDGLRRTDLFGRTKGFRQPGWAMAWAPGFTYRFKKHLFIVEVPITIAKYINPGETLLPGLPRVTPSGSIVPSGVNPNRQMGLVAPVSVSVRYVHTL